MPLEPLRSSPKGGFNEQEMNEYYMRTPQFRTAQAIAEMAIDHSSSRLGQAIDGTLDVSQEGVTVLERKCYDINKRTANLEGDMRSLREEQASRKEELSNVNRELGELKKRDEEMAQKLRNMPYYPLPPLKPQNMPKVVPISSKTKTERVDRPSKVNNNGTKVPEGTHNKNKPSFWKKAAPFLIGGAIICVLAIPFILVLCLI